MACKVQRTGRCCRFMQMRLQPCLLRIAPLTTHQIGDTLFVHAGIRPGIPLHSQIEDDLVWIREPFLSDARDHGALIVHGHTVVEAPTHYGNRVNIDTGAGYGGPVTAVALEGRDVFLITAKGRVPLLPLGV
jgi:serine/threonine protein phosphatase 1